MEEICGKDNIIDSMELAKAAFPQMHNSLDALCKRLEIDTTRRVKEGHGRPFGRGLLGQVYLVLKQQQGILEIDAAPVSADVHDISDVELPVIRATEEDLSENERVLEMVRKLAKGPALYDLDEETFNTKRKEEQDALDAKEAKLQDLLKIFDKSSRATQIWWLGGYRATASLQSSGRAASLMLPKEFRPAFDM